MAKKKTTTNTKKTVASKTTKTNTTRKKITNPVIGKTRTLHKVNIVLQAALALLVMLMVKPVYYALSLSFVTKDALLSDGQNVMVPAEKALLDLDVRWLLLAMILASGLYSILAITRWRASYEQAQTGRVYLWRWVILAITGAIMVKFASIVSGVEDIVTLKLASGMMVMAMAFAWLSERQNQKAGQLTTAPYWLALISGLVAMYAIIASLVGTMLFGMISFPWYVYALDAVLLVGFLLLIFNLRRSNRRVGKSSDYSFVERNYMIISLITQLVFLTVAIAGLAA